MELIKEGVNYRWGEFSIKIPGTWSLLIFGNTTAMIEDVSLGRVGYQCSNFYRKLIQEGKINGEVHIR